MISESEILKDEMANRKLNKKTKMAKKKKIKKAEPSEEELVKKYAKRVMMNSRYHGRVDGEKFKGLKKESKENKNIWLDDDFYFSVVFQTAEQKNEFLAKAGLMVYDGVTTNKIINGLEFAESLNIELKKETTRKYPTCDIDLMPYILDNEVLEKS